MTPNLSMLEAPDAKRLSVQLEIFEGAHAMAGVADAWTYLEQRGGAATPFQSYSVSSACMAAHERRQATPRIIVLKRNGQPTLIVPTVITQLFGFSVVRFLGDPLIQYADILACEAEQSDLVRALSAAADPTVASGSSCHPSAVA